MKTRILQFILGTSLTGMIFFLIPNSLHAQIVTNQIPFFHATMELDQILFMSGIGLVLLVILISQRNNKMPSPWIGLLSYQAILILLILFSLSILGHA